MIKEAKDLSDILAAFSEGKAIQVNKSSSKTAKWVDVTAVSDIISAYSNSKELRVKPDPVYRPYKNAQEFFEAQRVHGPYVKYSPSQFLMPTYFSDEGVDFTFNDCNHFYNYQRLLEVWTWSDGTKCGHLVSC